MQEITVKELKAWQEEGKEFQLIDVREPDEVDICSLGGELIPMADVVHAPEKLRKDVPVVLHCRSGGRSGNVLLYMSKTHGFDNLYNLKGGILAWADEIDSSMTKY